jgi:hypothetical protein
MGEFRMPDINDKQDQRLPASVLNLGLEGVVRHEDAAGHKRAAVSI